MLKNDIMVYVKTTETCNLNCDHCFTSGTRGAKIYFNPDKVLLTSECGLGLVPIDIAKAKIIKLVEAANKLRKIY